MTELEIYKQVLLNGCSLEANRVSLCLIDDYYPYRPMVKNNQYQVHSDNGREVYSNLFSNIDEAVSEFVRLKKKFKR